MVAQARAGWTVAIALVTPPPFVAMLLISRAGPRLAARFVILPAGLAVLAARALVLALRLRRGLVANLRHGCCLGDWLWHDGEIG